MANGIEDLQEKKQKSPGRAFKKPVHAMEQFSGARGRGNVGRKIFAMERKKSRSLPPRIRRLAR